MKSALLALLLSTACFAQDTPKPSLFGIEGLHAGFSVSFWEVRSAAVSGSILPTALGVGPEIDYHFKRWSLGLAVLGDVVQSLTKATGPVPEASLAPFACTGDSFGVWSGACIGPLIIIAGPHGGVAKDFNPTLDIGIVFSASPDLLKTILLLGGLGG